jgi:hypothetical protein
LLDVVRRRYGATADPDSDAGHILGALVPRSPFADPDLEGDADLSELTLVPVPGGVSVRVAAGSDMLVLGVPAGPTHFAITPPDAAHPAASVEITLFAATVPLSPPLQAAELGPDGKLREAAGDVTLHVPALLLVVTTGAQAAPATARLAPAEGESGGLDVSMVPSFALIGPGTAVGFGFERATLALEDPAGPAVLVPELELFVAPPGLETLAMRGGASALRIGFGDGGLSGDFTLVLADGGAPARPAFLRNLSCRLRLHRSAVTLAEIAGEIDLTGEVERRLGGALEDPDARPIDFVLGLTLDGGWRVALSLSSDGAQAFLWRTGQPGGAGTDPLRNLLGAYAVFAPLLAANLPGAGSSGYVDLALGAGAAGGLVAAGLVRTVSVTLFGGELVVRESAPGVLDGFLFFDLETELHLTADPLLESRRPLKVRHKSIGLRLDFGPDGADPELRPVFDPGRGFGFDLSDPGAFEVPGPLGEIVQPEGARMARHNPLVFETDLALKADLGVVAVNRSTVRVPISPAGPPTITALGARVDIPGALSGSGYLQLDPTGFAGSLDASLTPLGVRVQAGLAIAQAHDDALNEDVTAVLTTLGVELPVPLPLANSGLGLFGLLGLFAMHFQRKQPPPMTALDWFVRQDFADGNATKIDAWNAHAHQWALGLGAVLGTLEGGFIIHAKGMVVVEAPGPRLLILMNADLLSKRPETKGSETGTFLALIEIDPAHGLTIGIVLDYNKLEPLLALRVPVEAFFDFHREDNWHLDVGAIPGGSPPKLPASVTFFNRLRAEGYLLIHGNGIDEFPLGKLQGLSVAAGVRAALTWGPKEIGLYLEIAAEADVGISFKPFLILGKLKLSGELHLFIVGVEASASAEVTITENTFFVQAEVCGRVDFFFFEVEGCVSLELGERPQQLPAADPLLRTISLHSRSPALLPGTAVDRAVDGGLGEAVLVGDGGQPIGAPPVVPIDAIPALQFEMAPVVGPDCRFSETPVPPKLAGTDWVRRGRRAYRYTLKSVVLDPPPGEGEKPVVWWDRIPKGATDRDAQLALLNWTPDPTPAAAERTVSLDERVSRRWGNICAPVARPAAVLWSFHGAPLGPSAAGWTRRGIPWRDDSGTWRSTPPPDLLHVSEPWRSGNPFADGLLGVEPAIVFGAPATDEPNERVLLAPRTGPEPLPEGSEGELVPTLLGALRPLERFSSADALRFDAGGLRRVRLLLLVDVRVVEAGLLRLRALDADAAETGMTLRIDENTAVVLDELADLPGEWTDPIGPWQAPVDALLRWLGATFFGLHIAVNFWGLVLVETHLPEGTTQFEIGAEVEIDEFIRDVRGRYWGVLLVEGSSPAETLRFSHDESVRQSEIDVVNGALGTDQAKRALLAPDTTYTVSVTYDVAVADLDANGTPVPVPGGASPNQSQRFAFKTDAQPPARLEPWVLAIDPAAAQEAFFWGDPIRVVFATPAVRALYKAYGRELFAVVRAASGREPAPADGFDPNDVSLAATVQEAELLPAFAITPWESALGEVVAGLPCLEVAGESVRHERYTLTIQLEPNTDYILDFEARPAGDAPPAFRRHFATGRYQSAQALAEAVKGADVQDRHLANPAPLTDLGAGVPDGGVAVVRDLELERALRDVGWGDLARPAEPRVTVTWRGGAGETPQPVAVLLETPESLWRRREVPKEVVDVSGTKRFQMVAEPWLDVLAAPAAAPLIQRLVRSTEGGRTLVLLSPGARGGSLELTLRRLYHPLFEGSRPADSWPLVKAGLTNAPWEE